MTDGEKIKALQNEVANLKSELTDLTLLVGKFASSSEARRKSIQSAVDDLQKSVNLIFTNVRVPNVVFKPGVKHLIK